MKVRLLVFGCFLSLSLNAQNGQGVVINEFLASSDSLSGIPDPGGSFADWIELYNNNDFLINLAGFYLSDDYVFFDKFVFPGGAVIDGDGYVIIWADKDLMEAGLHADFKLNSGGEEIILLNSDQEVLDSISYDQQETNVSFARIPNGTGNFTPRVPTFSGNNDASTAVYQVPPAAIKIYPIPGSGPFTIEWPAEITDQPDQWNLLDMQGKSIPFTISGEADGRYTLSTKAPSLTPGIYLLWIKVDQQYYVKKLNIQPE